MKNQTKSNPNTIIVFLLPPGKSESSHYFVAGFSFCEEKKWN